MKAHQHTMLYKILTFQTFFLIFLFLIETTTSTPYRTRRQAADELLAQLGDSPRDQLAKMIITKKEGEGKFEGGKKQAEYLMRIENFLNERGEGFKDADNEWLAMARQRAREGRLRYEYV